MPPDTLFSLFAIAFRRQLLLHTGALDAACLMPLLPDDVAATPMRAHAYSVRRSTCGVQRRRD